MDSLIPVSTQRVVIELPILVLQLFQNWPVRTPSSWLVCSLICYHHSTWDAESWGSRETALGQLIWEGLSEEASLGDNPPRGWQGQCLRNGQAQGSESQCACNTNQGRSLGVTLNEMGRRWRILSRGGFYVQASGRLLCAGGSAEEQEWKQTAERTRAHSVFSKQ